MNSEANQFLYELYKRMPTNQKHPYFTLDAEQLYQKYHFLFEFYEDNYKNIIQIDKEAKILDMGFGLGVFMAYMKKNGFKNIYGIEYGKWQVDNARRMGFQAETISDLTDYLRNNRSHFDLIHASNIIEHLPKYDLLYIFDLLYNSLKHNGILVVSVPNIASYKGVYTRYLVLGHEIGFSEISLQQLFEVTHFDDIKVFSSQIKFRFRMKHILMGLAQNILNKIIGLIDYIYLGVNRPRHLGQSLLGVGRKRLDCGIDEE